MVDGAWPKVLAGMKSSRASQVSVAENSKAYLRSGKVSFAKVHALKICSKEVCVSQVRPIEIGSRTIGASEISFKKIRFGQIGHNARVLSAPRIPVVNTPVKQARYVSRVRHVRHQQVNVCQVVTSIGTEILVEQGL